MGSKYEGKHKDFTVQFQDLASQISNNSHLHKICSDGNVKPKSIYKCIWKCECNFVLSCI